MNFLHTISLYTYEFPTNKTITFQIPLHTITFQITTTSTHRRPKLISTEAAN